MASKTKRRHKDLVIESKRLAPVQDAVREYRVIEDGAYAYHLQEAEIEDHYSHNVNMRRVVQDDIRRAKELQDEEDRKARIMTVDEQQEIKQMDEELAEIIQEEIFKQSMQNEQERKEWEERDKEIALLMEETERRKVENAVEHGRRDRHLAESMQKMKVDSPPTSRDEHRMRLMSDEQLARRLQEEEKLKAERTKNHAQDMKSAIEMQDEELAKYVHDQDVKTAEMKYRKEAERRRKSKKKGKWNDEPLYYDDNYDLPRHRETSQESHPGDAGRRLSHGHHHEGARPKNHSRDSQRHTPNGHLTPSLEDPRHPSYFDERRHEKHNKKRPERPPPPKFDKSHTTEVKVPLDDSQRRRNDDRHLRRYSPDRERSREHRESSLQHHRHHDRSRGSSERNRRMKDSVDNIDTPESHRSHSEKQSPRYERERHPGSSRSQRQDGDRHDREMERRDPGQRPKDRHAHGGNRQQDPWQRQERNRPSPREDRARPTPKPRSNLNHSSSAPEFRM